MSTAVAQNNVTSLHDYKVADISLADFGRREITLADAARVFSATAMPTALARP